MSTRRPLSTTPNKHAVSWWDFRFSRWRVWRWLFSGLLRHIVSQNFTDVSKRLTGSTSEWLLRGKRLWNFGKFLATSHKTSSHRTSLTWAVRGPVPHLTATLTATTNVHRQRHKRASMPSICIREVLRSNIGPETERPDRDLRHIRSLQINATTAL
jgi:hypothetical protein